MTEDIVDGTVRGDMAGRDAPTRAARMEALLRAEFAPTALSIVDESARHAGHAGAAPGGETHFNVRLVSNTFTPLNRLARSRAVHHALRSEFLRGLHALSLQLRSPEDDLPAQGRNVEKS